ncbi:STAS domain-containing protein [Tolumonas lignilytica]|jgi:Anti-anti-sigma regulatory factor (antagonist of anti-sigma factor)|uniref:STAS domain-containing protein n=1 Tax=Tolumonas lignilytica TaxID=1283284 RepID=UPI0004658413|nr:STAS domain-containing protein [Tolumonas lignilytica]
MPVTLEETTVGQWCMSLRGPLTIYEVAEIQGALKPLTAPESLTIDLHDVDEIDTAGLQLLLALHQWLGQHLHLIRHSQAVIEIIDLFQLAAFFGDDIVLPQH